MHRPKPRIGISDLRLFLEILAKGLIRHGGYIAIRRPPDKMTGTQYAPVPPVLLLASQPAGDNEPVGVMLPRPLQNCEQYLADRLGEALAESPLA